MRLMFLSDGTSFSDLAGCVIVDIADPSVLDDGTSVSDLIKYQAARIVTEFHTHHD